MFPLKNFLDEIRSLGSGNEVFALTSNKRRHLFSRENQRLLRPIFFSGNIQKRFAACLLILKREIVVSVVLTHCLYLYVVRSEI